MTFFRPQGDDKKIHSKDEFELCYLRHRYLRKVNYNPTEKDMEPYKAVIINRVTSTYRTYYSLFQFMGFHKEDLVNIGMVHLVSFLGLYKIEENTPKYETFAGKFFKKTFRNPGPKDLENKNKAILTLYMNQRMEDVVRVVRQKAKNVRGTPTEEFGAYCGSNPPPENLSLLVEDNEKYGFKKIDPRAFKSIKKKAKLKNKYEAFNFAGYWYVAVPVKHRSLTFEDFTGTDLDPRDSIHNKTPEQLLMEKSQEYEFETKKSEFFSFSVEQKKNVIKNFIEENDENPFFEEEVGLAKKYLRDLRG